MSNDDIYILDFNGKMDVCFSDDEVERSLVAWDSARGASQVI